MPPFVCDLGQIGSSQKSFPSDARPPACRERAGGRSGAPAPKQVKLPALPNGPGGQGRSSECHLASHPGPLAGDGQVSTGPALCWTQWCYVGLGEQLEVPGPAPALTSAPQQVAQVRQGGLAACLVGCCHAELLVSHHPSA